MPSMVFRNSSKACTTAVRFATASSTVREYRGRFFSLSYTIVGGHEKLPGDGHEAARWRT